MTTNYPNNIDDTLSLPVVADNVNKVSADVINRLRDAIIAVESELGVKPSGISGTIKNRLDGTEDIITSLNSTLQLLNPTMGTIPVSGGALITITEGGSTYARIKFIGLLATNTVVVIPPGANGGWARDFWNATTGSNAFSLTVKTTVGGSGVVITQNSIKRLFADSTNVMPVS